MSTAFRISAARLKSEQQQMVMACEDAGITRNALANGMCVSRNLIDQLMSDQTTVRLTTEHDLFLRQTCAALGHYEYVERLLTDAIVTRKPSVRLNKTTIDDVLNGLEALGPIRNHEKNGEWPAVKQFGAAVKEAGWCIELEAVNQMDSPQEQPTMALSVPLFETVR